MATENTDKTSGTQWKGYSAYKEVASQLHKDVNHAVKAFSHINAKHTQGVGVTPQTAVNAKQAMLSICKRIYHELKYNADVQGYTEVFERWSGDEVDGTGEVLERDAAGYLKRLEDADLTADYPPFLPQMMDDLIYVSWKLGYIRTGVDKPKDPNTDETQVSEMFE
jgi:hypothetical protein